MRGGGERDCVLAAAGRREGWQVGKDPKMQASLYLFPPPGGDALHPAQANQWQAGKSEPVKGWTGAEIILCQTFSNKSFANTVQRERVKSEWIDPVHPGRPTLTLLPTAPTRPALTNTTTARRIHRHFRRIKGELTDLKDFIRGDH